jgi:hypothetical protein
MALLFLDSFDHYQTAEIPRKWTSVLSAARIDAGMGRCGTAALCLYGAAFLDRGVAFSGDVVIAGFAYRLDPITAGGHNMCSFNDATGRAYCWLTRNLDGSLTFWLPNPSTEEATSAPNLVHEDIWYFIEWKVLLHESAGTCEVRVNNVLVLTYSGRTQAQVPVAGGYGEIPRPARIFHVQGVTNTQWYMDDLYLLDGTGAAPVNNFLGDCRVEYLKPRAAGAHQEWPIVVGSSGSHWLAVRDDATPDEDGSYVEANAPGLTDTNLYQPTGLPPGQPIFGAQLSLYARKTEVGPRTIAPVVNTVTGPSVGPSFESYQYYTTPYGTNPATGSAWTVASINAIDAGVTVVT